MVDKIQIDVKGNESFISGNGSYLGKVVIGNGYVASCEDITLGSYGTRLDAIKAVVQRCGYGKAMLPMNAYNG